MDVYIKHFDENDKEKQPLGARQKCQLHLNKWKEALVENMRPELRQFSSQPTRDVDIS